MSRRIWVLTVGLGIVLLLTLLPQLLIILPPLLPTEPIGPIAGQSPGVGLPQHIIWWALFSGSLTLGIGLGIGLLGLLLRKRNGVELHIATPARVKLLIFLGTISLSTYVLNFLLPFPLSRYYSFVNLNYAKVATIDVGMAIGVTAATLALFILYYLAYRLCREQNDVRLWIIVLLGALLFALVNFFVCTTTSLDIYDYIARGRITAVLGGNPYVQKPADYPFDPFMQYPAWKDKTAAYGPLWETLSGIIGHLAGNQLWTHMLVHKDLALASYLLCVFTIALILRRVAPDRALAGTLLFAWNPLILMEGLANAHNDLLMSGLILIAFWFLAQADSAPKQDTSLNDRIWCLVLGGLAILMVWMAVLVKFIPFLLLPPFFLYTLAREKKWWRWLGLGLLLLVPVSLLTFQYYRVFWQWPEVIDPILRRTDMFRLTLPSVLVSWLESRMPKHEAQTYVGWPFLIAFALAYLILMARTAYALYKAPSREEGNSTSSRRVLGKVGRFILGGRETDRKHPRQIVVSACLNAFLLYLLLASLWFWPWYLIWPIALLALSDDERLMIPLTLAACAGQLSHVALNFVWYWLGELSWDTLYAVERPTTFLLLVPPLLAYAILHRKCKPGQVQGDTSQDTLPLVDE